MEWVSFVDLTGSVQNTPRVNHCWSFYDIEVGGVVKYLLWHRIQSQLNIGTTVTAVGFLVVKQTIFCETLNKEGWNTSYYLDHSLQTSLDR